MGMSQHSTNHTKTLSRLRETMGFSDDQTAHSAAVLIAITNEAQPRLLLTRRAAHLKSHPGEVSLPGGKREATDTSNASVALRETHEETGIHPFDVELLGELPTQRSKNGLVVKPIVGIVPADLLLTPEQGEIAHIFWADLAQLTPQHVVPHEVTFKGVTVKTPSFQVQDEVVWGLTGRILATFLNKAFGYNIDWPFVWLKP